MLHNLFLDYEMGMILTMGNERFTRHGPNSRLYYFLISSDLEGFIKRSQIELSYRSDHSPIEGMLSDTSLLFILSKKQASPHLVHRVPLRRDAVPW
jgi:hypothetical protein